METPENPFGPAMSLEQEQKAIRADWPNRMEEEHRATEREWTEADFTVQGLAQSVSDGMDLILWALAHENTELAIAYWQRTKRMVDTIGFPL
jgi:hypothetical protein